MIVRAAKSPIGIALIESTQGLAGIDYAIVIVYLGGILAVGTYFGRYVKTAGDFFIAGKTLPFWAVGMSIVVSDIGATDFIAVAGGTYKYGLAQANFDWIGSLHSPTAAVNDRKDPATTSWWDTTIE